MTATSTFLGYGGGLGVIDRHGTLTVELAGGMAHRSFDTSCANGRADGSSMVCGPLRRWNPQLRFGVTAEREKPVGIFATGFEVIAEHVELESGRQGILVLAGIVIVGGLHGR